MYDPYPATTAPVPEQPSCPPRLVSAVRSRPGVAWAFAPDGTPVPFPYPQPEALGEGSCAPVADGVRARLWR
ncbi:hypothetical protein ACFZCP_09345 [Streptomyces sp. NPDC007971]|uniref:hypothetical protein n=1 Tax=Streptomyces sp. NPDC007971 TaxID=3364799 RepID=UPI0036E2B7A9